MDQFFQKKRVNKMDREQFSVYGPDIFGALTTEKYG